MSHTRWAATVGLMALALGGCSPRDDAEARAARVELGGLAAQVVEDAGAQQVSMAPAAAEWTITVYKSPTCGCCTAWEDHLRQHGFTVVSRPTEDIAAIKVQHGVPGHLASCHTAVVDGYLIEGHVPADLIVRLLEERPDVRGLAVPGMPMGSPGMEGPYSERYDVLTFDAAGRTSVYARR